MEQQVGSRHLMLITDGRMWGCLECGRWSHVKARLLQVPCTGEPEDDPSLAELEVKDVPLG